MLPTNDELLLVWLRSQARLPHPHMQQMEQYALDNKVPIIPREVGALLYWLASMQRPRRILEIGAGIAWSTAWLAFAAPDAVIHTCERDKNRIRMSEENLLRLDLQERVALHIGDVREFLGGDEPADNPYDFIFIDAEKNGYPDFWHLCWPRLSPGGLLIADNVLFRGIIADGAEYPFKYRHNVANLREYLRLAQETPGTETVLLPVGDGLALTRKVI